MRSRSFRLGVRALLAAGALVLAGLAAAPSARADSIDELSCPGKHTLVRIDQIACTPNPSQPPTIIKRACCENPAGKVHCKPFRHCPRRSES